MRTPLVHPLCTGRADEKRFRRALRVDPWAALLNPRWRGGLVGPLGVPPQTPEVFLPR